MPSPSAVARALAVSLLLALARGRLVSQMRGGARNDRRGSSLAVLRGGAGDDQLAERATLDWPKVCHTGLQPQTSRHYSQVSHSHVCAPCLGQARPWLKFVRRHGVLQFISLYDQRKNDTAEELQWGDEIEYQLVAFDDESRTVRISLRADEVLADLTAKERLYGRRDGFGEACAWHPEYGAWMVEGTRSNPSPYAEPNPNPNPGPNPDPDPNPNPNPNPNRLQQTGKPRPASPRRRLKGGGGGGGGAAATNVAEEEDEDTAVMTPVAI